jgi:hypothetical protein
LLKARQIHASNASSGTQPDTATATVTIQDDDVRVATPPESESSSSGGGGKSGGGGGGAEGYLDMLLLAAALCVARRRGRLVERKGIEPSTFALRTRRSPI